MKYQYEIEAGNYEDISSGRVLYNRIGATAFPVRLASEIYQRCKARVIKKGGDRHFSIYDPCCGGGYLLATIGLLHGDDISTIYASDINPKMIALANSNLSISTAIGINKRIEEIDELVMRFNKESHKQALISANKIKEIIQDKVGIKFYCEQLDILRDNPCLCLKQAYIDIVITDVPYGNLVSWSKQNEDPLNTMLENLYPALNKRSVIALISDKKQKVKSNRYHKLEEFKVGKRKVSILEPIITS